MRFRLNKFIAQSGVASRREADKMIEEGKIRVNGEVVRILGSKVDPGKDLIEVNGKRIELEQESMYIMMHKPAGYLVTLKDPFKRPTVMELFPAWERRIFPVGRLDLNSEGLLFFTNDGELAHRLMHPRYQIKKVYHVKVKGKPDHASVKKLETGIYLDRKKTAPARISFLGSSDRRASLRVEIHEGRKREVRRMFEALGHTVLSLKRVQFAGLNLGKLKPGQWRNLTTSEVIRIKKLVGLR